MTVQMLKAFGVRKKKQCFFQFFLSFDCFRLSKAILTYFCPKASPASFTVQAKVFMAYGSTKVAMELSYCPPMVQEAQ